MEANQIPRSVSKLKQDLSESKPLELPLISGL
jgi:hypothetical protein